MNRIGKIITKMVKSCVLSELKYTCCIFDYADVVELVDTPDSKSGALIGVWVRVPPSAPKGKL